MITRVQVKNFRSIASADVSLGPLTVLVGRNGAGKSAFVDVLRFVRDALEHNLEYAFSHRGGISSVRRWSDGRPYDIEIHLSIEIDNTSIDFGFVVGSGARRNQFYIEREYCTVFGKHTKESYEIRDGKWVQSPSFFEYLETRGMSYYIAPIKRGELFFPIVMFISPLETFRRVLDSLSGKTYSIFPNTLRLPQIISNEETLLEDGSNFASVLRTLKRSSFFPDLRSAIKRIVAGVQDVRVRQSGGFLFVELQHGDLINNTTNDEISTHSFLLKENSSEYSSQTAARKAPWLGLEQESDGTLRVLAILTAIYQKEATPASTFVYTPNTLSLEEPEIALHPGALAVMADIIHEASLRRQVIITTQSPDLISRFYADELRVVEKVNGATQIGPLDNVQRQAVVDDLFSAGDLLRIEGLRIEPNEAQIK